MKRRSNWLVWIGFLLSLAAFVSYPFFFARFPVTRDFPWANLLLFGVAAVLVIAGVRRAFSPGQKRGTKIGGSIAATLSAAVFALFLFAAFIFAKQLPASQGAPRIGQKAPDFTLNNANGTHVALADLLTTPISGRAPKGVLLVFYRGYW